MRLQGQCYFQYASPVDGVSWSHQSIDGYSDGYDAPDGDVVGSFTSAPIFLGQTKGYCAVFSCPATHTPVGSVKLQGCCDNSRIYSFQPDARLVNWFDLSLLDPTNNTTGVTRTVSSATTAVFEDKDAMYRWVRVVYTSVSGSIIPTAVIQYKGIGGS